MTQGKKQEIGGFAGWVIRTVQQSRERKAARLVPKRMELVETLMLSGKRQVAMVSCDGQRFLVGMTADSVTAITAVETLHVPSMISSRESVPVELPAMEEAPVYALEAPPVAMHRLVRFGGGL